MRGDARPRAASRKSGRFDAPRSLRIDCVVSIMNSSRSVPGASPRRGSSASKTSASSVTCSGSWIFGSVTTKFVGSLPPVSPSSVREEDVHRAQSAAHQLLRERLDADADERRQRAVAHARATRARRCAWPSSSASGGCRSRLRSRCGSPRPARAAASRRRAARSIRMRVAEPIARANMNASTPCSSSDRSAFSPSLRAVSDLKRCAPPYTVCTGCRSPALPGKRRMNGTSAASSGAEGARCRRASASSSLLADDMRDDPSDERQRAEDDPVVRWPYVATG
jgi:hypothetical protein